MILLPDDLRRRLLAQGEARGARQVPLLKLFNPVGAATWLASELDADGDMLFGLADLGFGCPELGSFSLAEIEALRLPYGCRIERDLTFSARFPLVVYAEAARRQGRIVERECWLCEAAISLGFDPTQFRANPHG
ncbi:MULTISPECIES: DUF2958 domain-containing protein [unclassified Sphingobium]|uniref:DUF2958 domain-containing protein n=1 Tax=unclassified Sphingobium TaxID=2611147 RepID=UPI000D16397A|nr:MULTISPECIES: DUF2958 domain-containing protein [unclassified Sphingobium]MBG6116569.1 hypothetical protein [Sphingobium sp. JAI105]PSO10865.1 single-stranded DNA endonuclease [Sphingobium sp. AEW4]TWD04449.1 DUF2958 family protein [Sphingobium sp. AEW010]TWD21882.1 DUF2958 family protein [Sphingobium sp. AEW013]TWD24602.1 DUF2958 family protein [Sphingobium sp. AEW001]